MCRGKFFIFYYLSIVACVWPGICEKNWQKLLQNCQSSTKSHQIHAYHFPICAHLHVMPIYIASQRRYTRTVLAQCTHVHTLYSIWIYEVNIISFYFISFFNINIFLSPYKVSSLIPPPLHVCASKSLINAKIVCLDTFSWEWIWSLVHCY